MDPTQDDEAPKDPGAQKIIQGFDEKDFEGEIGLKHANSM